MSETQETIERRGQCLCGAVRITAKATGHEVGACHCAMCRRWGSGPFMEIDCGTQVSIDGEDHVTRYQSSDWAERAFCSQCGTNLFYRLKDANQHMVAVDLFDDTDALPFKTEVFIDEKPAYYSFAEDTQKLTGAELFAMVQGNSG
ncbi:MAG: GFA family protein [Pseudomonadota bacterium]